ncbi:interleukin-13 [Rhinolophus ferrumequinum]|uniref:interleukin-13 n=1 Tax=Rhinolophus ferrumequinum TaxID=59479 RepID=UPI00140F89EF|nr:interleukin-13 [Rhinolophus ferrumequinum]
MALWMTLVIALTCFGGLASPGPVPTFTVLRELIEELDNITQKVSASLCNGSMVWHVNLTANWSLTGTLSSLQSCAALESLINVSDCHAIQKTQRMLKTLCPHKPSARQVPSQLVRHTKIEVSRFAKDLLRHARKIVRYGKFN